MTRKRKSLKHQRQVRRLRLKLRDLIEKMALQEHSKRQNTQVENKANNPKEPLDGCPKTESGNDTAKTPEDSPTGQQLHHFAK